MEPNVNELKAQAPHAAKILERACQVPVPSGGDEDVAEELTNGEHASPEVSGEQALLGFWMSASGESRIDLDKCCHRLFYEEELKDGSRLHGWLLPASDELCWESPLCILEPDDQPWYGPASGEQPEEVGKIMVRLHPGASRRMTTQIMVIGEDEDWQSPTSWLPQGQAVKNDLFHAFGPSAGPEFKTSGATSGIFQFGGSGGS
eukprot:CAMPEP_0169245792 /NCGR_PEP_ID=MMETSP1016-20121227/34388_1 /TAXON_ID=342587 /ORGANISM="Karlodinium micrum, Strain CCMP2283" /LENGTH=203 /DNA_ID=CAMNT_0009326325 /DNA_START=32 /DNA_END=643 /DNA_ORIENTATION=-